MYYYIKRILDFILSLMGIVVLSPLFLIIILLIKIDSKGPILFKQKRVGKNKTYFYILKFRTMSIEAPKDMPTHLLEEPEQYITKVGKVLRKTSLDELPQIFNIVVGQMAIIGPRPALWNQYDLIANREKFHANDIRPGLTGLAQINGRDTISIEDKAKFDGYYVRNIGFKMDFRCFVATIIYVFKRKGIVEGVEEEVEKYSKEIEVSDTEDRTVNKTISV